MKKPVRNYSFRITLCDECVKILRKYFKETTEYVDEIPEHQLGECDLCKHTEEFKQKFKYLPL